MFYKNYIKDKSSSEKNSKNQPELIEKAADFIAPIIDDLGSKIDKRFTYTFFDTFFGILSFRNEVNSLLLSELGGYINGHQHAPAGTKRISNLLRNEDWDYKVIKEGLLNKTQERLSAENQRGKQWLMHWDDSVLEKAESWKIEGLCSVFSSKASRLTKIKPGYYKKYGRICVPGFEWSAAVLSSLSDSPTICNMEWWTTKGKHRECGSNIFYRMLREAVQMITPTNAEVWHVFDRGYANVRTLDYLINHFNQHFIIRWKSQHLLVNANGETKNTYKHSIGKKSTSTRKFWDKERKEYRKVSILYMPVKHPEIADKQLYLVIARDKKGSEPIYFLTDVEIDTNGMAWCILKSYMRRWDVEQVFRFGKTAMGIESIRLWFWENRLKLLMIVTLVMAFLLTLIASHLKFCWKIIDTWCHRTGNRQKKTFLPIYRLRLAISLLILYELVLT